MAAVVFLTLLILVTLKKGVDIDVGQQDVWRSFIDWAAGSESNDYSLDASLGDRGAAVDSRWLQITTMSTIPGIQVRCANIFLRGEEFRWTSRERGIATVAMSDV